MIEKALFFRTIREHLIALSRKFMYRLCYTEAADEASVDNYKCFNCKKYSKIDVYKTRKRYQIKYIENDGRLLYLRSDEIFIDFRNGFCSQCGGKIAEPMFNVLNCAEMCQALGLFRRGKNVEAIRLYDMKKVST